MYSMQTRQIQTRNNPALSSFFRRALEHLINFAYSGSVKIDNQNVQSLMVGAAFLQLNKVRDACADFLVSRFHAHNVIGIRQFADNLGCTQLVAEAEKFIHTNFTNVSQSEEFLSLGKSI